MHFNHFLSFCVDFKFIINTLNLRLIKSVALQKTESFVSFKANGNYGLLQKSKRNSDFRNYPIS